MSSELSKKNFFNKDQVSEKASSSRVNINDLLHKVRIAEKKEKKDNYIYLGVVCGVVAVTGIIASL